MILRKKRRTNYSIIAILWIAAVSITIFLNMSTSVIAQYRSGSPAPEFTLEGLDEEVFQLNQFLNKQQHLILFFIHSEEDFSINKFDNMATFFNDYQPRESYQIIAIIEQGQHIEEAVIRLNNIKEKTEIPLIILVDVDGKINTDYEIKNYPAIFLLRADLHVRKVYGSRFTSRQEANFYQYLKFIFTSQKSKDTSSGCNDGVCPPPPGFE